MLQQRHNCWVQCKCLQWWRLRRIFVFHPSFRGRGSKRVCFGKQKSERKWESCPLPNHKSGPATEVFQIIRFSLEGNWQRHSAPWSTSMLRLKPMTQFLWYSWCKQWNKCVQISTELDNVLLFTEGLTPWNLEGILERYTSCTVNITQVTQGNKFPFFRQIWQFPYTDPDLTSQVKSWRITLGQARCIQLQNVFSQLRSPMQIYATPSEPRRAAIAVIAPSVCLVGLSPLFTRTHKNWSGTEMKYLVSSFPIGAAMTHAQRSRRVCAGACACRVGTASERHLAPCLSQSEGSSPAKRTRKIHTTCG